MRIVKSSVALLLGVALGISAAPGDFFVSRAAADSTVDETTATETPKPTATVKPTSTPKPTATPKPTKTPRPTRTPKATIKPVKPKAPKISCTAKGGFIIIKYNAVKNAERLEIRYQHGKDAYRYNYVYGKEKNGTVSVKKGKMKMAVYNKKGKYTVKARAYSAGRKYHSKWVKKTVNVKKVLKMDMDEH